MGITPRTQHSLSIQFLALAFAGVSLAQGLPPDSAPPPVFREAAQAMAQDDARVLGIDMATKLAEKDRPEGRRFPFNLSSTQVIPADKGGRAQFHPTEKYRILTVSMVYPQENQTANARARVGGGDGQLVFQHITLKGEGGAKLALNYATRRVVADLRAGAARATGGLIVKGNRIGSFEDGTRFLAHSAKDARSIAMNQVRQFAHMSFLHSGGKDESFQLEVFVMGPGEVVITLPSDLDGEQLLEAGFDQALLTEMLGGKKVPGQGRQVSYILAGSEERKNAIDDDLKHNRTRAAIQNAQTREQGGPVQGATDALSPPGGDN